ncbi:hypothetical protein COT49_03335 [candidate division WWE3 bacterium CG08_land_8_20_14_0_20_40_13]|uniref:Uncharacterized protein n=1 Tax=candidate division WWE3 bacterium CG08_land_8_20_14_0_20_40_13 TaxID=1975084 RepID=A0A2H0XD31_UNCKA|nr:MAG: hypothetical protein COT49_03335 [candidate division WWE3 bacterium CG08_land_8_20_14_0_20_40_13]
MEDNFCTEIAQLNDLRVGLSAIIADTRDAAFGSLTGPSVLFAAVHADALALSLASCLVELQKKMHDDAEREGSVHFLVGDLEYFW